MDMGGVGVKEPEVSLREMSIPDMLLHGGFTKVNSPGFPPGYGHFVRVTKGSAAYREPDIVSGGVRYAQMGMELPPIPNVDVVEVEESPPRAEVRWTRYRGGTPPETEIATFMINGEPLTREAASMKTRLRSYAESMP